MQHSERSPDSRRSPHSHCNVGSRATRFSVAFFFGALLCLAGCGHFHSHKHVESVYVATRQPTYLRDRVAAISNHTAQVSNGERLQVLEHIHRFLRVQTEHGDVGWIEDAAVLNQAEYDSFVALQAQHAHDPVISRVVLRDDRFLDLTPGVKTEDFYLIPANTKLEMLARASVPKAGGSALLPSSPAASHKANRNKHAARYSDETAVPMEDWWLVRDSAGHTGWMLARQLDVDVPDDVAQYADGQRMVGAYKLRTVSDPASGKPNGQVPEYVTVLTSYKDGLPYDFNTVRVFTWDMQHHRYGTAFQEHNLTGFFPVTIGQQDFGNGPEPVFSIQVAPVSRNRSSAAKTGVTGAALPEQIPGQIPVQTETQTYRLEGNWVHRVLPVGTKPQGTKPTGTKPTRSKHSTKHHATQHATQHH